jgi:hypothetical protein
MRILSYTKSRLLEGRSLSPALSKGRGKETGYRVTPESDGDDNGDDSPNI